MLGCYVRFETTRNNIRVYDGIRARAANEVNDLAEFQITSVYRVCVLEAYQNLNVTKTK
jgi:hypothetical protein